MSPAPKPVVDAEILELAEAYSAENGQAVHVNAAFILADENPPPRELPGFTAKQSQIIQAHYARFDPHDRAADDAKLVGTL